MKDFTYKTVTTIEEATESLSEKGSYALVGGTDILGLLKDETVIPYPETIINLKGIKDLDYIKEEKELHIGALTTLTDIAENKTVREKYSALAQAAHSVASPLIRNQATIGGNLCQEVRCWYFRSPDQVGGSIDCARKNGSKCYAATGLLNQHSIFGGQKVCTTPCTNECPTNVDISAYMSELRKGNTYEAAKILMQNNPIPCITSRVCTHFCQQGCNRNSYDENVGIGNIERYLGDYILDNADQLMPAPKVETDKKIAIVGSGPAGLSAAYYLRRAGHSVKIYEKMPEPGGLLMYAIPEYRLPKELVRKLTGAIANMGVEFICNNDIGGDTKIDMLKESNDAVFLDTGAWKPTVIGIEGEELTRFGLEFLVEVKQWMSEKPEANIVVVGGGNVSVDVAVSAKRLGAASVTMVSLESKEELPATKEDVEQAEAEGIHMYTQWGPNRILREGNKIIGIELKRCTSVRDASGRFSPIYDVCELKIIEADTIFLATGQSIDLSFLGDDPILATERGRIIVTEETQQTSVPGIYAGGDVATGPSTVVNAIAAGKNAARDMLRDIGGYEEIKIEYHRDDLLKFDSTSVKNSKTKGPHMRPMEMRSIDTEDNLGLPYEDVMEEAKRCLNCGCLAVHPSDIATALVAMDATIITNKRTLTIDAFLAVGVEKDEIVTEIIVPTPEDSVITTYDKFRQRESIDFAMVGLASAYEKIDGKIVRSRIVLGAVAPVPIRAEKAEKFLIGKEATEDNAIQAAEIALEGVDAPKELLYKINVAKTLIKRSILRVEESV